jgi:hypothetical protein
LNSATATASRDKAGDNKSAGLVDLRFEPVAVGAAAIGAAGALGDDALGADLARRLEHGRAIADKMIDRDKTWAAGTGNDVAQ